MIAKKTKAGIALAVLLTLSVATYAIFIPRVISLQYKDRMHSTAAPLEDSLQALVKSTELPLIRKESITKEEIKADTEQIAKLTHTTRQQIANLKTVSSNDAALPYSGFLMQYEDQRVLEARTKSFIAQTEEAIDNYEQLLKYLELFAGTVEDVRMELNAFNEVTDINSYSGQAAQMSQVANKIQNHASLLSNTKYPSGMQTVHAEAITAFTEAAIGFEELAYGLTIPADDPIYTAVQKIEEAALKLDNVRGVLYDDSMSQSRIIKNIQDLDDKLELILGS